MNKKAILKIKSEKNKLKIKTKDKIAKLQKSKIKNTAKSLFLLLALKRFQRTGWLEHNAEKETIAAHSFFVALFALVLSKMENLNEKETYMLLAKTLSHDLHELKIGDISKVQKTYIKANEILAKEHLFKNTFLDFLLNPIPKKIEILANDADKLDLIFQAYENKLAGHKEMDKFIKYGLSQLKSSSAKKLAKMIKELKRKN